MSDYLCPTDNDAQRLMMQAVAAELRCALPGFIEEFDPETNLAKVRPAIKAKISIDGEIKYEKLDVIIRVPVVIPYGQIAKLCLTVPIKKGDECTLVFSDRMIDNFIKEGAKGGECVAPECCGGANKTSEPRTHSLADAICFPGCVSQPYKIPEWNTEAIELRNYDRTAYISLDTDGKLSIKAPGGMHIDAPTVNATHEIIGEDVRTHEGFDANPHLHSDVQPGGGNTGTYV